MASRMERYYKDELVSEGRSSRNKDLYKQIENMDNYSNIEGVVSIENTNEIDISKVKEMIRDRESYKKQKELNRVLNVENKKEEPVEEKIIIEEKNYDINSILTKAKESEPKKEEYHSLGETQYKFLKSLNKKGKDYDLEKEEEELKELINTITSKTSLNDLKDSIKSDDKSEKNINDEVEIDIKKEKINTEFDDDDVGLLDDLKSNTMIGDASSIKKLINEEKRVDDTGTMDKTFLTTSMGFTQNDFEEFKDINNNINKNNKFIIILISIVGILVIAIILFILLKK